MTSDHTKHHTKETQLITNTKHHIKFAIKFSKTKQA